MTVDYASVLLGAVLVVVGVGVGFLIVWMGSRL